METLYERLKKYKQSDYYPFHMPGHKRNLSFLESVKGGIHEQSLRMSFSGSEEILSKNDFGKNNIEVNTNEKNKRMNNCKRNGNGSSLKIDSCQTNKNMTSLMWNSYGIDITEIEGFDNLHDASGILADSMKRAARVCGAKRTYFLVNGSTCGLLSAISACVQHGDDIIVARNCHKAVYHAIELNELTPHYIYPQEVKEYGICGGISSEDLKKMLITYKNVKLVVVTSPTYEGVVSDIRSLADTVHEFGVPLLVDEAHGAHFGHYDFFPKSALSYGADIVIQSMHKTMPAFTQTALLHLGNNTMADRSRIEKYLSIYQTSSPSYLFMASIDWCMDFLEQKPDKLFEDYKKRLKRFYERAGKLRELEIYCPIPVERPKNINEYAGRVSDKMKMVSDCFSSKYEIFDFDFSKLNIFVKATSHITGSKLYDILLEKYHLQMEMVSKDYVLAMTSICDTDEGMERLIAALEEIDRECIQSGSNTKKEVIKKLESISKGYSWKKCMQQNPVKYTPYQVQCMQGKSVLFTESQGKVTKEYVYLYPPGIPLLVPGEEITLELIERIKIYQNAKLKVWGWKEEGYILVVDESEEK